jgi:hypothetical protein
LVVTRLGAAGSRFVKVDPSDPKAVARTKALIRLLYTVRENSRKTPLNRIRSNVRFRELETVFAHCWRGVEMPDDDAGRDHLYIAACHLWHLGKKCGPIVAIRAWVAQWARWCGPDELAALIDRVEANPRMWSADELAHELGLYTMPFVVRQALGLTTIGSIDVDKAGREQRRAANSTVRSEKRRREGGAVPRSEWLLANNASQTKPWIAMGMKRSRYYELKKLGALDRSEHTDRRGSTGVFGPVHDGEQPESGAPPARPRLAHPDEIDVTGVGLPPPPWVSKRASSIRIEGKL